MTDLDEQALAAAVREVSARHARRLGGANAADLAHDASVRLLMRPPPDGHIGPWLERIARNLAVDRWRSRARAAQRASMLLADPSAPPPTPEDIALAAERRRAVRRSLRRLPRDMRRSILIRFFAGLDAAAAGTADGVSAVTVRTRVHRAIARLRRMLAGVSAVLPGVGSWARFVPMVANTAAVAGLVLAVREPVRLNAVAAVATPVSARVHAQIGRIRVARTPITLPPTSAPTRARERRPEPSLPAPPPPAPRHLDFDDDDVTGEIEHPDAKPVIGDPRRLHHLSLIEIPDSFAAALAKTIEDL